MSDQRLNPYVVGGEISDAQGYGFYGRDELFRRLGEVLSSTRRPPILLYGQRRIGKSSVMRQFPRYLPAEWTCVYYDLQGKGSLSLDQVLYGLARGIAKTLGLPPPGREETTADEFAEAFLPRALDALDDQPQRLVLLFDEFDVIDEHIQGQAVAARSFIGYLGRLAIEHPQIGYVLIVGRKSEELTEEVRSAIFKNAVQEQVGRIGKASVFRLATELAGGHIDFSGAALERIFQLTEGQPYCAQLLCHLIWSRNVQNAARLPVAVGVAEVEDAVAPAIQQGTLGLNWIFDGMSNPGHRVFLAALAQVADPLRSRSADLPAVENMLVRHAVDVFSGDVVGAPEVLANWGVIAIEPDRRFRIMVPMVGEWIRIHRPLEILARDAALTSPRAYEAFRRGSEAQEEGKLDLAAGLYRNALVENPNLHAAHRALAETLRKRMLLAQVDDIESTLKEACEAFERALDVDPNGPRQGYMQLLADAIEHRWVQGSDLGTRYRRLQGLDDEGRHTAKIERMLRQRADRLANAGLLSDTVPLYRALNEGDKADRHDTWDTVNVFLTFIGSLVAAVVWISGFFVGFATHINALLLAMMATGFWEWMLINPESDVEMQKDVIRAFGDSGRPLPVRMEARFTFMRVTASILLGIFSAEFCLEVVATGPFVALSAAFAVPSLSLWSLKAIWIDPQLEKSKQAERSE